MTMFVGGPLNGHRIPTPTYPAHITATTIVITDYGKYTVQHQYDLINPPRPSGVSRAQVYQHTGEVIDSALARHALANAG